jgi:hypothetical protein
MTTSRKQHDFPACASSWHEELSLQLAALNDAPLECDGMTHAISAALSRAQVSHRCMTGYVTDNSSGNIVTPHLWVELGDGWIVDFRLRMWLGDEERVPHGVFRPQDQPEFLYQGICRPKARVSLQLLDSMTEGRLSHVKVPREFVEENPGVRV